MTKLLWEVKTLVCSICKERPMKKTIEITRGNWVGICEDCEPKAQDLTDRKENGIL